MSRLIQQAFGPAAFDMIFRSIWAARCYHLMTVTLQCRNLLSQSHPTCRQDLFHCQVGWRIQRIFACRALAQARKGLLFMAARWTMWFGDLLLLATMMSVHMAMAVAGKGGWRGFGVSSQRRTRQDLRRWPAISVGKGCFSGTKEAGEFCPFADRRT